MKRFLTLFWVGIFAMFLTGRTVPQDRSRQVSVQKDTVATKMPTEQRKMMEQNQVMSYEEYNTRSKQVDNNINAIDKQLMASDSLLMKIDKDKKAK